MCSILDGYSRNIVHWDLREKMTEADIEIIMQGAKEKYPEARPRIISDNGPQFIAKDFKEFIRISGMTHVRTSPFYPQSNGKIERWHKSLKSECIRPGTPLSLEDARRLVEGYVDHYNNVRLNSATGYITPKDICWRVGSRRSTQNATTSWKRPDSSGRVAASMRPEEQRRPSAQTQLVATDPVQAGLIWRRTSTSRLPTILTGSSEHCWWTGPGLAWRRRSRGMRVSARQLALDDEVSVTLQLGLRSGTRSARKEQ